MEIFTIIIFGLATIRTIMPLSKPETWKKGTDLIATFIMAGTMSYAYIWFIGVVLNCA